jgi:hypothetical protein
MANKLYRRQKPNSFPSARPANLTGISRRGGYAATTQVYGCFDIEKPRFTVDREVRKHDEKVLVWGTKKVLSTTLDRVGAATQTCIIDVQQRLE